MRSLLLAALISFGLPLAAGAAWVVDPSGGGDFLTIQAAIDAAQEGDEILVLPGTYLENIDFLGKDLWIHSQAGLAVTVIDGSAGAPGDASCVQLQNGETEAAVLQGFTLTGGRGTLLVGVRLEEEMSTEAIIGGAVFCMHASATFLDCRFVGNAAAYAGAISLRYSTCRIHNCEFLENVSDGYAGAIGGPSVTLDVSECLFEGNVAGTGDGTIHIVGPLTIRDSVFRGNRARAGAALNAPGYENSYMVTGCWFEDNESSSHGGGIRVHEGNLIMRRCTFVRNHAAEDGGGLVFLDGAGGLIENCTFYQNEADRDGGQIALHAGSNPMVANCILAEGAGGGGLFCSASFPGLLCNDAWNNAGGDYLGVADPTGTNGNISADPLFCNPAAGEFTIRVDSPCAPDHNPGCGLIGADEVGCSGSTAVEGASAPTISWGRVKGLFR